jgi:hypothetical protein
MSPAQAQQAKLSLIKAARSYARWARSRVTATNRERFERAQRRLHKAAERYALCLPAERRLDDALAPVRAAMLSARGEGQ